MSPPTLYSTGIEVIDTSNDTVIGFDGTGTDPRGIVVNPAGTRVYVANHGSNDVFVIDTSTNFVLTSVPVGLQQSV
jgi:YVTN family beta-propeller protein